MRVNQAWLDDYNKRKGAEQPVTKELTEENLYRSEWEADYAHMLDLRKGLSKGNLDRIVDWKHEPFKLKLYTKVTTKKGRTKRRSIYYIPDFLIEHMDGSMELVEVKGYERKAGELKYFQAVKEYPLFVWRKVGKESGAWTDIHFKDVKIKGR